jgi:hypothetical protein
MSCTVADERNCIGIGRSHSRPKDISVSSSTSYRSVYPVVGLGLLMAAGMGGALHLSVTHLADEGGG